MIGNQSLAAIYRERMAATPELGNALARARVFTAGKSPTMRRRAQLAQRAYLAAHEALGNGRSQGSAAEAIATARRVRLEARIEADVIARKLSQNNRRFR